MCGQKFGQSYRMRGINKRSLKNDWEGKDIIMKVWQCNQSLIIVIVGAKLILLLLLVLLRATNLLMWLYRSYFSWIIRPIIKTSRSAIKRWLYFCAYFLLFFLNLSLMLLRLFFPNYCLNNSRNKTFLGFYWDLFL